MHDSLKVIATVNNIEYEFKVVAISVERALEEFYINHYGEEDALVEAESPFSLDVAFMKGERELTRFRFAFDSTLFHYCFAENRISLDDFMAAGLNLREKLDKTSA